MFQCFFSYSISKGGRFYERSVVWGYSAQAQHCCGINNVPVWCAETVDGLLKSVVHTIQKKFSSLNNVTKIMILYRNLSRNSLDMSWNKYQTVKNVIYLLLTVLKMHWKRVPLWIFQLIKLKHCAVIKRTCLMVLEKQIHNHKIVYKKMCCNKTKPSQTENEISTQLYTDFLVPNDICYLP